MRGYGGGNGCFGWLVLGLADSGASPSSFGEPAVRLGACEAGDAAVGGFRVALFS